MKTNFVIFCVIFTAVSSQAIKDLPTPIINVQCGQSSFIRNVNLVPSLLRLQNQQIPTTCTYKVHAVSGFICQMRFDFVEFSLLPPTVNPYPRCVDESMTVGNVTLCGVNTGQHIYVPINPLKGERFLQVTINTQSAISRRSTWKIAVHQFECPLGQTRSINAISMDNGKQQSKQSAVPEKPSIQPRIGMFNDWLAPQGCLQYFVQSNGTVESFNLNNGVGPYIGDMSYAICFRRTRADSMIRFIPMIFRMGYATDSAAGYDEACYSSTPTMGRPEDYIFIPNAVTDGSSLSPATRASRFCGQSVLSQIITSSPPGGPFMIYFNSDRIYEAPDKEEIGFRFDYEIV